MNCDLSRFKDVFFEEASEHASAIEAALLGLETAPGDAELLNTTFRAVHSIKGSAGMFGFDEVVRFAHAFESLLDRLRNAEIVFTGELGSLLLRADDVLKGIVASARTGQPAPGELEAVLEEILHAQSGSAPAQAAPPESSPAATPAGGRFRVRFEPSAGIFATGMDPMLVLRDLAEVGRIIETRLDASRLPAWEEFDPESCYLAWEVELETGAGREAIQDAFAFVEDHSVVRIDELEPARIESAVPVPEPAPEARPKAAPPAAVAQESSTVRVHTAKIDKLVDLVGELVIARSVAGQILAGFTIARLGELLEAFSDIERNTRELQERVMAIRMQPLGGVFSRFPRLVRDLSAATGKKIALEIHGEETELDKSVIERLGDPLTHLIRNSIDHGIEPPADRAAAGKAEQGLVRLSAFHEGGNVIVEVADDGRGLDPARIRAKAVERGWMGANENLGEEELQALIFKPGFSTAETVSDISGRGVGMDVVRRNVEALNGSVNLRSEPGRGTRFRIKLPLTLAVLDGLLLRVGSDTYVLPLVSIIESVRPKANEVARIAGRGEVVVVRGEPVPLVRLHALFGAVGAETDPAAASVVIFEHDGRKRALLVDELLGQQQVVIKSLETHFRKVEGALGATILGDGRAALILDAAGLATLANSGLAAFDPIAAPPAPVQENIHELV